MSYSFNVRAATKALALSAVIAKIDEVVVQQPIHAHDQEAAKAAAETFIGLVRDPGEGEEISVSVNGSVSSYGDTGFVSAGVGVSASVLTKTD